MASTVEAERVLEMVTRLRQSVQRVIVGKDDVINLAIIALLCRGHILVEDVPGIGKTTMAKALAQSLGCTFKRIQFTPDLMPTDVLGVNFFNQKSRIQTVFVLIPDPVGIYKIVLESKSPCLRP